ncbi:MAG: aromatic-ring-hydroxylating dioxygenase subunit beta [Proteobacteria bacterium]|nr:aromatic-ring-hydroxylating dioxygenase subunit beta [Pseudomonadota bacterium]
MNSATRAAHDPSRTSHYVTDALYRDVVAWFTDWQREDRAVTDAAARDTFRRLVEREARLLDNDLLEEWAAMLAPECIYWIPASANGGDPRREITITFDDRRRLEDRIYRLRTGYAWSQKPKSRTVRLVGNVEAFICRHDPQARMLRSNVLISEFRGFETRCLAGWCAHRLRERAGGWEITVRQLNLIDCDRNLRNPSVIL